MISNLFICMRNKILSAYLIIFKLTDYICNKTESQFHALDCHGTICLVFIVVLRICSGRNIILEVYCRFP